MQLIRFYFVFLVMGGYGLKGPIQTLNSSQYLIYISQEKLVNVYRSLQSLREQIFNLTSP